MGGRGTYSLGKKPKDTYKTVDTIAGAPVLKGIGRYHSLPEESKSSNIYIKLKHTGQFHELRIYDKNHYLTTEIAYHPEPNLDPSNKPVLHYHTYDRNFKRSSAKKITKELYDKYHKYFKGVYK